MAGHSKWANIKHRKERQDAKKGKVFTKWIRELTVAARQGGGDPASNPRLRLAQDKALGANMSRDIIDRAIARGAGAADADDMVELGFAGGVIFGRSKATHGKTDAKHHQYTQHQTQRGPVPTQDETHEYQRGRIQYRIA